MVGHCLGPILCNSWTRGGEVSFIPLSMSQSIHCSVSTYHMALPDLMVLCQQRWALGSQKNSLHTAHTNIDSFLHCCLHRKHPTAQIILPAKSGYPQVTEADLELLRQLKFETAVKMCLAHMAHVSRDFNTFLMVIKYELVGSVYSEHPVPMCSMTPGSAPHPQMPER